MGLGDNGPIRRREFDRYAEDAARRLAALERWRESHEQAHDDDDDDERDGRRWSWQQVVAWAAVAAVLVAAWLSSTTGR